MPALVAKTPLILKVADPVQTQQNTELVAALRALQAIPFLRGHLLTGVAVGTASTAVLHKLGRKLSGWWAVQMGANTVVWQPQAPTDKYLYLQAGTALSLDVWVF